EHPMTSAPALEFDGLTAIVTGGGAGIGAATIRALQARGARAAALDLDPSGAPEGAVQITVDVTDSAAVKAAVDRAAEELGGIDIVINNAGIGAQGQVDANDDAEWARVLDVNVISVARVTSAALPYLRKSSAAAVVNTASIASLLGLPER